MVVVKYSVHGVICISTQWLGHGVNDSVFEFLQRQHIFSSPKLSHRGWGPHSLLFRGYRSSFAEVNRLGSEVDHSPVPIITSLFFHLSYQPFTSLYFANHVNHIYKSVPFTSLPFIFFRLHFPSLVFTFLTLVLKICFLVGSPYRPFR
jgi:hypothetical protein